MDIVHRIGIKAPAAAVYAALASIEGLAAWWTRDTQGEAAAPGGRIDFRFRDGEGGEIGGFGMEVLALQPEQAVHWQVREGPPEWVATTIDFQLSREDEYTILMFGHRDWREPGPFMAHCSTKWATFLLSLRDFVETGHGRPAPQDLKVGNWH